MSLIKVLKKNYMIMQNIAQIVVKKKNLYKE